MVDKELSCGTVQDSCYLKEELVECSVPCGALLDCKHPCTGTCYACKMGRLHIGCKSKCDRTPTCGHLCDFPCTPSCPPCSKPCANFAHTANAPRNVLNHVLPAWSLVTGPVLILLAPSHAECCVIDLLAISHVQSD